MTWSCKRQIITSKRQSIFYKEPGRQLSHRIYSTEGKGEEAFESEKSAAMATNESVNENPSLVDVWKVLTEIKANNVKLVLDVEL